MNAATPAPRLPWPLAMVAAVGALGHLGLAAGGALPAWLLPVGLAIGVGFAIRRRAPGAPPTAAAERLGGLATAVAVLGAAAITWGSLATLPRSWDGYATWHLTTRHLLRGEGLDAAYFADPGVYHYIRGYPLLQPILETSLGQWFGAAGSRLWYPLAWWFLLGGVAAATRAGGAARQVRWAVLGVALVPLFVEPGHGSAESGFADLLVAGVLAYTAQALLANAFGIALAAGLLLPWTKHEGTLHLVLWLGLAAATGRHRAATGLLVGGSLALGCWLPLHARLLAPGAPDPVTVAAFAPLLLLPAAALLGTSIARWRWRAALAVAVLAPCSLWLWSPGAALQPALATGPQWSAAPGALATLVGHAGNLRLFGATFPLLLAVAWLARRRAAVHPAVWRQCFPLLAAIALFTAAIAAFLVLAPDSTRSLFGREGVPRYLAQLLGVAWITIAIAGQSLAAPPAAAPPCPPAANC